MIKVNDITQTITEQKESLDKSKFEISRDILKKLSTGIDNFALIISGIRRAGKSTVLRQLIRKNRSRSLYLNFDTPRLYNFTISDFEVLDLVIQAEKYKTLYFDEIQIIEGWEVYVRQKLDQKYRVVISGSNSSMLSQELGTKLTGRHISKELFPFSYKEFLRFTHKEAGEKSYKEFLEQGGFPEFVRTGRHDVLPALLNDILFRDIAVRYGVRDVNSMKKLIVYLITNSGKLVTANKLAPIIGVKSNVTVLDYFSYFEQTYLISFMSKFSYSARVQAINPRKAYCIDNGLINAVTTSHSRDAGRKLETAIFHFLRLYTNELNYFNENNRECDFVVSHKNSVTDLIQVCYEVNYENRDREIYGLLEAMDFFKMKEGKIVTFNQRDVIKDKDRRIKVIPAYEFCSKNYKLPD